jgi:hypothetical protein
LTGDSSGTVNIWARWARRPSNRASVRISVPWPDGKEIVLAIIQPQEVFGEIALLDGKERTADARTIGAC